MRPSLRTTEKVATFIAASLRRCDLTAALFFVTVMPDHFSRQAISILALRLDFTETLTAA
jgi:hypothetical protein